MLMHDSRGKSPIAERLHQLNEFVLVHAGYGGNGTFASAFSSVTTATGSRPVAPKRSLGTGVGAHHPANKQEKKTQ